MNEAINAIQGRLDYYQDGDSPEAVIELILALQMILRGNLRAQSKTESLASILREKEREAMKNAAKVLAEFQGLAEQSYRQLEEAK